MRKKVTIKQFMLEYLSREFTMESMPSYRTILRRCKDGGWYDAEQDCSKNWWVWVDVDSQKPNDRVSRILSQYVA